MEDRLMKNIGFAETLRLGELVDYQEGRVVSRTLAQLPQVGLTLFSISRGEGISAHTSPGDALVQILDGVARITIGEQTFNVQQGQSIVLPSGVPHALDADENFKFLLTVIKP
ncbi:MAG: cupin domain-containing protein [Peptococcaceae bacterium]|nr:cupin domain-containing protein [Peptococcaceae bacterium]